MADQDNDQLKHVTLGAWRRMLQAERGKAAEAARAAAGRLADAKFHPFDIARAYAQMMNGVAVPSDFTENSIA